MTARHLPRGFRTTATFSLRTSRTSSLATSQCAAFTSPADGDGTVTADGTKLFVVDHELDAEDFTVQYAPVGERSGVAAEGRFIVVVDLTIDATLQMERRVRDLNRSLQDLRKEAGL